MGMETGGPNLSLRRRKHVLEEVIFQPSAKSRTGGNPMKWVGSMQTSQVGESMVFLRGSQDKVRERIVKPFGSTLVLNKSVD